MAVKSKTQLKDMLKKAEKGNMRLKSKKVGRWERYYVWNPRLKKWGHAYYTPSQVATSIKQGQIKSIV